MYIFPAIDIIDGKVVRLSKGDYSTAKTYDVTAESAARSFFAQGATHIHAVDLDGAKLGKAVNADIVRRIIAASGAFVEIGGGIRTESQIQSYLAAGAGRVILGTAAVRDFGFTVDAVEKYGEKIAVGVDAADGKVAVSGWREITETDSVEFCERLAAAGVKNIIYTDIACDGALGGANLEIYERLVRIDGANITASGGICSLAEIVALKKLGVHAAILGKALYEHKLDLRAAVELGESE